MAATPVEVALAVLVARTELTVDAALTASIALSLQAALGNLLHDMIPSCVDIVGMNDDWLCVFLCEMCVPRA